jgi:hypothetical protein
MKKLLSFAILFPGLLVGQSMALPVDYPVEAAGAETTNAPSTPASATLLTPLTAKQKINQRAWRLIEPVTLVDSAFGAGIRQWRNTPPQWGQGAEGYAKRFASSEGFTAADNGIALGFDLALHLDPRYRRLPDGTAKQRVWNAVSQSFLANKDSGGRMINVSELAGDFGGAFVARTWEPHGYNSAGDALINGALGFAYHVGKNMAREFLPGILHRTKQPAYAYAGTPHSD